MAHCFLDKNRGCSADCMAYSGTPTQQKCVLLEVTADLTDMLTGKIMTVKHPVSAPPPEIKL